jgi:hypothetical protein
LKPFDDAFASRRGGASWYRNWEAWEKPFGDALLWWKPPFGDALRCWKPFALKPFDDALRWY